MCISVVCGFRQTGTNPCIGRVRVPTQRQPPGSLSNGRDGMYFARLTGGLKNASLEALLRTSGSSLPSAAASPRDVRAIASLRRLGEGICLGALRVSGESTRLIALTWEIKGQQVRVRDDYDASGGAPGAGHAL
jgi:hypothetical protein